MTYMMTRSYAGVDDDGGDVVVDEYARRKEKNCRRRVIVGSKGS